MDATFIQKRKSCVADEEEEGSLGSLSSLSTSSSESSTGSSASSDLTDDTASSSSPPSSSSSCPPPTSCRGPLFEMSALKEQLPFKRGLSKFYQGKSQSFTSFSDVKSFEDLVKPERRPLKKLKTSKSCGGGLDDNRSLLNLKCCGRRIITKKAPKSSLSSSTTSARRNCSLASKPPLHPQRPSNVLGKTSLVRLNI